MSRSSEVEEILVESLENLYDEFKSFKKQLGNISTHEGWRIISSQSLKRMDEIETVQLLIEECGETKAAIVVMDILRQIHRTGDVFRLKAKLEKASKPKEQKTRDFRAEFRDHTKRHFEMTELGTTFIGEGVTLRKGYCKLLIVNADEQGDCEECEMVTSGRKHLAMFNKPGGPPFIYCEALFDPGTDMMPPRTVVLLGVAGIGKTVTARKMILDWASGDLYKNRFDFVFYISCRKVNEVNAETSLEDLVLQSCPNGNRPIDEIFANPEKLLFIIDGFDELKYPLVPQDSDLCSERTKKTAMEVMLMSLLHRKVLPTSSLMITTRPTALEKLKKCLGSDPSLRFTEILGFSEEDRKEYFSKFFGNEAVAKKALSSVKDNDMLFTMCFLPIVCHTVCTVIQQQILSCEDLKRTCNTVTSIYMLYLSNLLKHHCRTRNQPMRIIQGLCSLAAYGIRDRKILFEKDELEKHGLQQPEIPSVFLNNKLIQKDLDCQSVYSFFHLSFQELFAAMHYMLAEDKPGGLPTVNVLLEQYAASKNHFLMMTVRFLFGLLNEKRRLDMEQLFGCKVSDTMTEKVLNWVQRNAQRQCYENQHLEIFHCLYEMEEEELVRRAMNHFQEIQLRCISGGRMDYTVLVFCLRHCQNRQSLALYYCDLGPAGQLGAPTEPVPESWSSRSRFTKMSFSKKSIRDSSKKATATSFTERFNRSLARFMHTDGYSEDDLRNSKLYLLCAALKSQNTHLKKLELRFCNLRAGSCRTLSSALHANPACLSELDLSDNGLRDPGVGWLCEAMPPTIEKLTLVGCSLTSDSCKHLWAVLGNCPSLVVLNLGRNDVGDAGVKLLSEGLKHSACRLQALLLAECKLTDVCCSDLSSVLSTNQSLLELDLLNNLLGDQGVKELCEGMKSRTCTLQSLGLSDEKLSPHVKLSLNRLLKKGSGMAANVEEMVQ